MISFLSPTSISLFEQNKEAFYLKYIAKKKPPRSPQTQPMAVGSAFDAFVKSYLYRVLVGENEEYERDAIFEAQVEPHNRSWAYDAGQYCFNFYKDCGALKSILTELKKGFRPRFEFAVQGEVEGIPLMGKPDIFFMSKEGARVIYDWKINGFCARSQVSPMKGYLRLFPGNKMHRDCVPYLVKGVECNISDFLENLNPDWARQLSVYSWLLGETVGSQLIIAGLDQIVCKPSDPLKRPIASALNYPELRVANHRMRISEEFQVGLMDRIKQIWEQINSDHFFTEMSLEDSKKYCEVLESQAETLASDPEFDDLCRG